mgnify:CR=1 FL=1
MKEKAYYIANKARQILGGTLSANQCRDYVLALLFLKSASEYYKSNDSFQQDDNKLTLHLLVSERSSFDYLCKALDSPDLGRLINMALYELEQANGFVTEGYEINKAIDFESNILGEANTRSSKLRGLLQLFQYRRDCECAAAQWPGGWFVRLQAGSCKSAGANPYGDFVHGVSEHEWPGG